MSNNPNSRYFDSWAKEYTLLPNENSFHLQYVGSMIRKEYHSHLDKTNLTIMELGIGNARFFNSLKIHSQKIIGLDISEKQLQLARLNLLSQNLDVILIQNNLEDKLKVNNSCIDLGISNASIHHIKDKPSLFSEVYRSLISNGLFVFFDFYFGGIDKETREKTVRSQELDPLNSERFIDSIRKEYALMPSVLKENHPMEYHLSPAAIISLLSKAGFKDCKIIPTFYDKYVGVSGVK